MRPSAGIAMKPLHPIMVHFPLALLPLSVGADAVGLFAGIASLSDTGWWALLGAALASLVTVAAGFYDMSRAPLTEEVHHRVHRHMRVGLLLGVAIIGLAVWRGVLFAHTQVVPIFYLDLAVLTVALAMFQGWLGGELVYVDGVFVRPSGAAPAQGEAAAPKEDNTHKH